MGWHLHDIRNFMSKLTLRRLVNAAQVWSSYQWTRISGRPVQWGLPITMSFEPTTACNLRCPECPSGLRAFTRETGNLKADFFRRTIDQVADRLMYLIFYFQGEPYINPDFLDMVAHARSKGIYTITSTNGHFLDDERARRTVEAGLDRLIISVDGTTQEVYEQYRREGSLEQVLAGARNIVKWKQRLGSRKPHTVFQFLVVRPNEHQIPEVYRLAREIGIDEVKLKTAQVYDYKHGNPLIPTIDKYARYRLEPDGTYRVKNTLRNRCWKLWHACVITWNGTVVPCCFDKDASHPMGDLRERSFREIWHNGAYRAFRTRILAGREKIDICTNCTEGCKVWA
ncbi:MAG: radical SAM/SPASM domain-containing protein [Saprospiraceae bacterium]|nr:radical SAM/SPASM domain-containing protein [Saprospiraceae bacterium]